MKNLLLLIARIAESLLGLKKLAIEIEAVVEERISRREQHLQVCKP